MGEALRGSVAAALGKADSLLLTTNLGKFTPCIFATRIVLPCAMPLRVEMWRCRVFVDRGAKMEADLLAWMDDHKEEMSIVRKIRSRPSSRASTASRVDRQVE